MGHYVAKGVPLILGPHDLCNNCQLGKQAHEPILKETIHLRASYKAISFNSF
jgi:hypothetical protein